MIRLRRSFDSGQETLGIIFVNDWPICLSLEDPWNDNKRNASCIPVGKYTVDLQYRSPKYGIVPIVLDVPGRDHILIHAGNTRLNTKGCILPGRRVGRLGDEVAVLQSKRAMREFLDCFHPGKRMVELEVSAPWT